MDTLKELFYTFSGTPLIQAPIVVLFSAMLAKFTDWFITRVLTRLTKRTRTDLDDRMLEMLHKPIFYSVLLTGLGLAFTLLEPPSPFGSIGFGLIKTLVVFMWLVLGIRMAILLLDWMTRLPERFLMVQPATKPLFEIAAKLVLIGGGAYFVFISWGIDVTGWLASAGIVGIAVGFAAKDTLANLFAGVFILADAPYKVGDFIVLDSGERGQVSEIGIRSTRILTRDDIEITIPNSTIANAKIINESGGPHLKHRNRVEVGVAYGSDVDLVKEILLGVAQVAVAEKDICSSPGPLVRFISFGDSALIFELLYWIENPVLRGRINDLLNTALYKALAKAQLEIPFPKRDVYIRQMPESTLPNSGSLQ